MRRLPLLPLCALLACGGLGEWELPVRPAVGGAAPASAYPETESAAADAREGAEPPQRPLDPTRGSAGEPVTKPKPFETVFEHSSGTQSATYDEGIGYWKQLVASYAPEMQLSERGPTDAGRPLSLVLFSTDGIFDPRRARAAGKRVLLINNAIHPGEPDGVDASMMLLRDIAQRRILAEHSDRVLIAVIPFYNIGGALNRSSTSRVNQNGPAAYGFRGSSRNYDLNRDFVKSDTLNARSFAEIFHFLDPDVLIDTHVSNGADYQHIMTLAYTQKDKLGGELGRILDQSLLPFLYSAMRVRDSDAIPYVNAEGTTPEKGWVQFMDWPRYSTGYAALFQTLGIMSETHMLKPYKDRVASTYALLASTVEYLAERGEELARAREETRREHRTRERFALSWKPDMTRPSKLDFKGYEARRIPSKVTSGDRLLYDRSKPFERTVDFYDNFQEELSVSRPRAYVFSQAWSNVAELLRLNRVEVRQLESDQSIEVESYQLESFSTAQEPFEGHYPHDNVKLTARRETLNFHTGDYYVPLDQATNRYIVETLEPQGRDSFFRWNFFDSHLQQKEHFSAYVFEDIAEQLLAENRSLREQYNAKLRSDAAFAKDPSAQLEFIYDLSAHHEPEHRRYPVFRVLP